MRGSLRQTIFIALACLGWFAVSLSGCECGNSVLKPSSATLQSIPGSVVFSAIPIGQSEKQEVILRNVGEEPLTLSSVSLQTTSAGEPFQLEPLQPLPVQLVPGQSYRLTVVYKPSQEGIARGQLLTKSNAANADVSGEFKIDVRSQELAAGIKADPNPVDFGTVAAGKSETKTITLSNTGNVELEITKTTIEDKAQGELKLLTNLSFPVVLAPRKSIDIEVQYTPKSLPVVDAKLLVENNSSNAKNYPIRLVGKQSTPNIEVTPLQLAYSIGVGGSQTKTITIKNRGTLELKINALGLDQKSSADFSLKAPPSLPLTVEPNGSTTIEVDYNPKDTKDDVGTLEIQSNDPDSPTVKVNLTGKSGGCYVQAAPETLHFTRPMNQSFSIINQGNKPCQYKTAYFGQSSSTNFSFFAVVPRQQEIGPGQKLSFEVKYAPPGPAKDTGEVVIEMDNPNQPELRVPLTSDVKSSKECDMLAKPTNLDFGLLEVGLSKKRTVELTNFGFGDCHFHKRTITSSPAQDFKAETPFPASGLILKSGETHKETVSFTPSGIPSASGELVFTSENAGTSEVKIELSGSLSQLCLTAAPIHLDFGASKTSCSIGRQPVLVYNICTTPVSVSKVEFGTNTNTTHKEFTLQSLPRLPFQVAPRQAQTIELAYVPQDLGNDLGTLEVHNAAYTKSFLTVTLEGSGVATDEQTDTFKQVKDPELDILFVIDNSGSMGNDQSNVATNLKSFFQWAVTLKLDYHIGVTTTDVGKDKGCLQGNPKVVTPQTPNLESVLETNVKVGTGGSSKEYGLEASRLSFQATALQGCNAGFYRKDANLSVIYISDEIDQSPLTVDAYINFLRNLKGLRNIDKLRASALGYYDTSSCQKNANCRYYAVAKVLGGVYETIRTANWANTLSNLGAVTFGRFGQFFLSRPADPKSIKVTVDSKPIPEGQTGWSYDATNNSVRFAKGVEPGSQATVEVTYKAVCLKP